MVRLVTGSAENLKIAHQFVSASPNVGLVMNVCPVPLAAKTNRAKMLQSFFSLGFPDRAFEVFPVQFLIHRQSLSQLWSLGWKLLPLGFNRELSAAEAADFPDTLGKCPFFPLGSTVSLV